VRCAHCSIQLHSCSHALAVQLTVLRDFVWHAEVGLDTPGRYLADMPEHFGTSIILIVSVILMH